MKLKHPQHVQIENGHSCRDRHKIVAKVKGAGKANVLRVRFSVGKKRAGHDDSAPFKKRIQKRLLRGKRRPTIRAIAEFVDGRVLSMQKRIRICADGGT